MREIKFRYVCYNKTFKEISFEYLTDKILLEQLKVPNWITSNNCEIKDTNLYTGLKDKNGKEVYEGDIVKTTFTTDVSYEVKYNSKYTCFTAGHEDEYRWPDMLADWINLEVIGNIYENHGLLEELK